MAMTTSPGSADSTKALPAVRLLALLLANVALAFGPLLVRLTDTGPVAAGFWRLLLPLPLFVFLAWRERARRGGPAVAVDRRLVLLVLAAGMFFALDLASWHVGIELTRLGNATLFGNVGSLVLMVWGIAVLRRWPRTSEYAAMIFALTGAALLLARSLDISAATLAGDLFCIVAGLFYACYLLPAQAARRTLGPWSVLMLVCLAGAPVLLVIALALGEPVWPEDWRPVVALAVSSQLVGQGLLVYTLRHFPPFVIGVALLIQPAIAAASGWWAFDEGLGGADALGMVLVMVALLLARASPPPGRRVAGQPASGSSR
jgi:drug/metabolite transporter (DMT)-like permease